MTRMFRLRDRSNAFARRHRRRATNMWKDFFCEPGNIRAFVMKAKKPDPRAFSNDQRSGKPGNCRTRDRRVAS
jgi:hypothetical protein